MTPPNDNAPRRELLFAPAWFPNKFNPASGSFNREIARLLGARYRVGVIYVHFHHDHAEGTHLDIEREEGFEVIRSYVFRHIENPSLFPLIYTQQFMRAFHYFYGQRRPDLIYVRGVLPGGMAAWALRSRRRIPYVTTESFSGFPQSMESWPRRVVAGQVLRRAEANSAVSSYQRDVMQRYFPREAIEVLPNVIAPEPPAEGDPGPVNERLRMLYVGNLVPVKGWDILLEAYRLFLDRARVPATLTMVGGGDTPALERKLRELDLDADVDYLGRRPHDEVKRLMRRHHFLVLPSRVDTCPNVVLEAMMQGRPVLATRSGGAEDLVDTDTGFLVEKESPGALCEGMSAMRRDYARFDPDLIHRRTVERHSPDRLFAFLDRAMSD